MSTSKTILFCTNLIGFGSLRNAKIFSILFLEPINVSNSILAFCAAFFYITVFMPIETLIIMQVKDTCKR